MSSEDPDQPATEDVSFADILDQPEAPPSADAVKAAQAATAPSENGEDAVPAAPAENSGKSSASQPMDTSDEPPGAAGSAGDSAAAAPPPGVVKPAEDGAKTAKETPASVEASLKKEDKEVSSDSNEITSMEEKKVQDDSSDSKESVESAPNNETKAEETKNKDSEPKAEKDVDPNAEAPAAKPTPSAASTPTQTSKPSPKPATTPKAAAKPKPAPKTKQPAAQSRPIPPDAEPVRAFSGGAAVTGPKPKPAVPEPEPLTELEKLWKPVKQNPADFTAWTLLIQYAEAQCFMEDIRDVLKAFLARYPYCYGYWKKYSDLEKKRGTPELCNQVFERGLAAVPLSVDLWLHYLSHMRTAHEDSPELVRAAFERAIAACGTEFRSDRLWEQYATWETSNKEPAKALAVYKRAIAVPTLSYRTHFENLEQLVGETPPQELLSVGEFLDARRAVLSELKASEPPTAAPPSSDLLPPGCDEPPPGVPAQPAGLSSDEECVKLRAKILAPLRQLHKETEKQVSLRWNLEEGIKRPYFHVKPLEKAQLKNWKSYLDFEIEQGDKQRIMVLFERCMIACALYEEFWVKYIRYLETQEPVDLERMRSVYRRACWTHLPNKPAIHMLWAAFEERQGDLKTACEVMDKISTHVTMLEVLQRRVNLARRAGRLADVEEMYAEAIKTTQHRETAVVIAIKFVRFLYKIRDNREKALEVLREAIEHDKTNMRLYMQLVDIGFQSRPVDVSLVSEAFQMALEAPFEQQDKLTLLHRRVEFLEEFSSDAKSLQTAQDEYHSLLRVVRAEAKKKKQEEETSQAAAAKRPAGAAANGTEKKARVDSATSTTTTSGTHIPTITETPARPPKTTPYRPPAPQQPFNPGPRGPAPGFTGFNQPPPGPHQQQYQYNQQQHGWPGYPPQYNYNQYGQGYQYPYQ